MSGSHDARTIWQNQETEGTTVTLEDIHARAATFEKRVRNRNLGEYVAAAFVVVAFGFVAWHAPGWMIKLGSGLSMAAAIFVTWQLHRRGRAHAVPDGGAAGLLAFHREALARQRDALRTVGLWYLLPVLPGFVLMMLGRYTQFHAPGRTIATDHMIIIFTAVIVALVFVAVLLLNLWGAARLQNRIHELDRLRAE
jgi:hypothetical protein